MTQRDLNYDGKTDVIDVEVTARGMSDIRGVQAVLQFEYVLRSKVHLRMKGLAYVQHAAGTPGGGMTADGQLRFRQQNPLKDSGVSLMLITKKKKKMITKGWQSKAVTLLRERSKQSSRVSLGFVSPLSNTSPRLST